MFNLFNLCFKECKKVNEKKFIRKTKSEYIYNYYKKKLDKCNNLKY